METKSILIGLNETLKIFDSSSLGWRWINDAKKHIADLQNQVKRRNILVKDLRKQIEKLEKDKQCLIDDAAGIDI